MVQKQKTPDTIRLKNGLKKIDFKDTYATTNTIDDLETITRLIFESNPTWLKHLFKLRNAIAKKLGLQTQKPLDWHPRFIEGGYIGFFKIYAITTQEILLGADDKHLNFRVSILNTKEKDYNIKVSSLVQFHNLLGYIYFGCIYPLHHIIIKKLVAQAYKKSSN